MEAVVAKLSFVQQNQQLTHRRISHPWWHGAKKSLHFIERADSYGIHKDESQLSLWGWH